MNHDTPLNKETPWAGELPHRSDGQGALAPMLLEAACPLARVEKRAPGRPATLSTLHLALAVLWGVLVGLRSQRAVWRLICTRALGRFAPTSVCDQTVYDRLQDQGENSLRVLFEQVSGWLRNWLSVYQEWSLASFATEVYILDESTLDSLGRWLKPLRALEGKDLLAGRLCALFDVRRQLWVRLDVLTNAAANCKVHARAMLEGLPSGCLLLFDLGYFAFEWVDDLTRQGFWWVSRVRQHSSFTIQHVFVETQDYREMLIQLGGYRTDWAAFTVRLIEFRYRGIWYSYMSNVLNPLVRSGCQIARLYARRWDIEMAFRVLKDYLGLRMLWSAKWPVIVAQVWSCAILAQCLHALQVRLAAEVGVPTFDVSLEILLEQVDQQVQAGLLFSSDVLTRFKEQGRHIGLVRPCSRIRIVVPEICWTSYLWPPADLVYERAPRYGHRPAGNWDRQPPKACVT
ncbi:MAG TPA: transposase [Ktedonobacteraceae bacterium]|jgi:hypothetical protein